MSEFRYYHPIEVRYGDLDPQGHLNNAKYFTYTEQARIAYWRHLGLWKGGSFLDIGIILAEARMTFKAPILWGHPIRVGVRVSRLGNKSFDLTYTIEDTQNSVEHARGSTVQVAYDYHSAKTIPIPDDWRQIISEFENHNG
jgi:acyl-CoA thioester hydrolase